MDKKMIRACVISLTKELLLCVGKCPVKMKDRKNAPIPLARLAGLSRKLPKSIVIQCEAEKTAHCKFNFLHCMTSSVTFHHQPKPCDLIKEMFLPTKIKGLPELKRLFLKARFFKQRVTRLSAILLVLDVSPLLTVL